MDDHKERMYIKLLLDEFDLAMYDGSNSAVGRGGSRSKLSDSRGLPKNMNKGAQNTKTKISNLAKF